jgi:hypothetical protein
MNVELNCPGANQQQLSSTKAGTYLLPPYLQNYLIIFQLLPLITKIITYYTPCKRTGRRLEHIEHLESRFAASRLAAAEVSEGVFPSQLLLPTEVESARAFKSTNAAALVII